MLKKQIIILSLNIMGIVGAALVVYGVIVLFTNTPWPPIEAIADWISSIVTLIATVIVALSVYLPPHHRPPDKHSKLIISPLVVLAVIAVVVLTVVWQGWPPPQQLTNGFAILGLSGALFRMLPFSEWQRENSEE